MSESSENDESNPWITVASTEVYDNDWITVCHNDVVRPDGESGIYGMVHFKNRAVAVVPLDRHDQTWLVGQYRYTTQSYSWEVPEGGVPDGENLIAGALRELREETGLVANTLVALGSFFLSNSVTDEIGHVFVATDLIEGDAEPEGTEQLQVKKVSLAKALSMVDDGTIEDAFSVSALLKVDRWLRMSRLERLDLSAHLRSNP